MTPLLNSIVLGISAGDAWTSLILAVVVVTLGLGAAHWYDRREANVWRKRNT